MGRAEVGTPKYLANKMKAKGLQKLRWYCQMCQKQCRDENGFKCHTMSESHQRQLLLFADNSKKYIDAFSHEFATGYLELLRRRFGTKRVNANKVYQEYIADRNHLHMNATRWLSLTGFVLYLGKTGKCTVDETEKGWYITYIDRDPETIAQQEKMKKKEKMDKDDEERLLEFIEYQVERGKKEPAESGDESAPKEFVRENEDEQIKLNINLKSITQSKPVLTTISAISEFKRPSKESYDEATSSKQYKSSSKEVKRKTALDEIIQAEEARKERRRTDYWLAENIVVKLVTKALGDKYYKQKAIVTEVIDKYKAKIKLLESGEKLKVDQEHLETVIPAIGKHVLIVNGGYKAEKATLKDVDERNFCVTLEIASGLLKGRILKKIQYEDISKLA